MKQYSYKHTAAQKSALDCKKAFYIDNMRFCADGSLKMREGYKYCGALPHEPRAILKPSAGDTRLLALAYNGLYSFDTATGEYCSLGSTDSYQGDAAIFRFEGKIYVVDGSRLLVYNSESEQLEDASGYVPLYGKEWNSTGRGDVYETPNFLSRKIRINYFTEQFEYEFDTGLKIKSVDSIDLNGNICSLSDYNGSIKNNRIIRLPNIGQRNNVTFCVTLDDIEFDSHEFFSCTAASHFTDRRGSRICLYDGEEPSNVFVSSPVENAELENAKRLVPNSAGIYFPVNGRITVGDGAEGVNAICMCKNKTMLFTESESYRLSFITATNTAAELVDRSVGSNLRNTAASVGRSAVSISQNNIYLWDKDDSTPSSAGHSVLYLPPSAGIEAEDMTEALFFRPKNEIWFAIPDDIEGRVAVYNCLHQKFSFFSGIYADRLFEVNEKIGFIRGNKVYLFSPELKYDVENDCPADEPGEIINASLSSPEFDFDLHDRIKRIYRSAVDLTASGGGRVRLDLYSDSGKNVGVDFFVPDTRQNKRYEARGGAGGFRKMKYRLSFSSPTEAEIHSVELYARK